MSTVQSKTENLKIIVKLCVKPFDHRERKIYYWSEFLVVAGRLNKIGEVEVKLVHIEADRIVHKVLVGEVKFKRKRTHFESTFLRVLVVKIGIGGPILEQILSYHVDNPLTDHDIKPGQNTRNTSEGLFLLEITSFIEKDVVVLVRIRNHQKLREYRKPSCCSDKHFF